jgi:sigma-E factor negative regulatory protein RseC
MDSPIGKIIAIGSTSAQVEVARTAACPRCAAGKGCGAGLLSGTRKAAILEVPLAAGSGLCEGDEVVLALEPAHLLRAAMLVYGLPLLGILLALTAGWLTIRPLNDGAAIVLAVAGLAAGLMAGRWQLNRHACLTQFVPRIEGRADGVTAFR